MKLDSPIALPQAPPTPAWLLAGLIAGTAGQLQQAALLPLWIYALLVASAGALLALRAFFPLLARQAAGRLAIGLLAGLALGFGLTGWRAVAFEAGALNPALEGRELQLTGRVLAMPQRSEDAVRFRLGVEAAHLNGQAVAVPRQIYLSWYAGFARRDAPPKPALALLAATAVAQEDSEESWLQAQREPQAMRAGERWHMTVKLKAPHGNRNPHGFDYELWLWEQGLQATGYVRTGARDMPPQKLADRWQFWVAPIERARQSAREAIFARVSDRQQAGVLAALVVGDQNAIERADWDVFRATGVAHLMSISGLHITLFAWLAAQVLGWLWQRSARWTPVLCLALPASSAAAWGGLLLAIAYAAFAGWGVPAQRTVWMLATVVLLRQSGRHWPWPQVWLLAMGVVVALDPWALMQAGFWLSFVAVGVLFAAGPPQGEHTPFGGSAGSEATSVEASSTAGPPQSGAAPSGGNADKNAIELIAYNARPERANSRFDHEAPAHAPFWMLRAGRATWRMLREQWVITLALTPVSLLLFNQVSLVGLLANALAIPWVTLLVTPLALLGVLWAPLWEVAAFLTGVLTAFLQFLASWPMASISKAAAPLWCAVAGAVGGLLLVLRLPWHWRVLGVPLILPLLLWQPLRPAPGEFELIAADVGQGNAVIVRTATHTLLYDAGPRFSRESDAGHRVLVPLLRALGERLHTLVLSHRDSDHTGGAPAVLAMQPQAALLSSLEDGHALQQLRPSTRCVAGQRWVWDGISFELLHPAAEDYESTGKPNALSCVLRISSGARAALLAGDIELAQEQSLSTRAALRADFLLVPHHGSKTSSSAGFLDAVQPRVALVQAGYRNRFGHPAASVLDRYRERGIPVFKSADCGAATWRSARPDELQCERQATARYWQHQSPPLD